MNRVTKGPFMKRMPMLHILTAASAITVLSCASQYTLFNQERSSEANALRSFCLDNSIDLPEVSMADSLMAIGNRLRAKGNHRDAYNRLDFAVIFYQLAIAKFRLGRSEIQNKELETSLNVAKSKLAAYEKILTGLKPVEKQ